MQALAREFHLHKGYDLIKPRDREPPAGGRPNGATVARRSYLLFYVKVIDSAERGS